MDILRNLFGSVTSGLIRLAVTGGILFLCYLFIVKPVLETTDEAIKRSGIDQVGQTFDSVNRQVQRQIRRSFRATRRSGASRDTQKLVRCIQRSSHNVQKIQRCTRRF